MATASEKFLEIVQNGKLYPPLNNYSAFMQGSEYNVEKYFGPWYGDLVQFHLLILMKKGFSQVWGPEMAVKNASSFGLKEYISDAKKFEKRLAFFYQSIATVDQIYEKFSYAQIKSTSWSELLRLAEQIRDLIWSSNAAAFYTIYLDKDSCWQILQEANFPINKTALDQLWTSATEPTFASFDKNQSEHALKTILLGRNLKEVAETCQYFLTDYYSAKSINLVEEQLKKQYGRFISDTGLIQPFLEEEQEKQRTIEQKHSQWVSSLTPEAKQVAEYIQMVMKTRDRRKNFFAKGLTIIYRIAERMFSENDVSLDLIPFYTMRELLKGPAYLKENLSRLQSRQAGVTLFIPFNQEFELQEGSIDSSVKRMNDYYISKESSDAKKIIKGQVGSPGNVKGVVRIVLDVASNHGFQENEILVTGMTRPEYVPLMKKAAGIITDEGGITCHAAIVSRELGIPCVIGTKIATRALKTGDKVELDAQKGIVTIL